MLSERSGTRFWIADPDLADTTFGEFLDEMDSLQANRDFQVDDLMIQWNPDLEWVWGDASWIRMTINQLALAEAGDSVLLDRIGIIIDNLDAIQSGYPEVNLASIALWSSSAISAALSIVCNPPNLQGVVAETATVLSSTAGMFSRERGIARFDQRALERYYRWCTFTWLEDPEGDEEIASGAQDFDGCFCMVRAHQCFVSYLTGSALDNVDTPSVLWADFLSNNDPRTNGGRVPAPTAEALYAVSCAYRMVESLESGNGIARSQAEEIREATAARAGLSLDDPSLARALAPLDLEARTPWHLRG